MVADVPVGAFLSGGIDSSAVVALMARPAAGRLKTFSIGFEEQDFSELHHARRVAEHVGAEHHEFVVRPDALEVLPKLVEHYGEPYADSSAIPTYYVARETRRHVTVALNGDGGDEAGELERTQPGDDGQSDPPEAGGVFGGGSERPAGGLVFFGDEGPGDEVGEDEPAGEGADDHPHADQRGVEPGGRGQPAGHTAQLPVVAGPDEVDGRPRRGGGRRRRGRRWGAGVTWGSRARRGARAGGPTTSLAATRGSGSPGRRRSLRQTWSSFRSWAVSMLSSGVPK